MLQVVWGGRLICGQVCWVLTIGNVVLKLQQAPLIVQPHVVRGTSLP